MKNFKYILASLLAVIWLSACSQAAKFELSGTMVKLTTNFQAAGGVTGTATNYPVNVFTRLKKANTIYNNYKYADPVSIGDLKPTGRSSIFAADYKKVENSNGMQSFEWQIPLTFVYKFIGKPIGKEDVTADYSSGYDLFIKFGKNVNEHRVFRFAKDELESNTGITVSYMTFNEDGSDNSKADINDYQAKSSNSTCSHCVIYDDESTATLKPIVEVRILIDKIQ